MLYAWLAEGLWGLVNNAGLCTLGPVEWLPMKNFRRDPEVNVFGLIAATKAFLPLVRRGKGKYTLSVAGAVAELVERLLMTWIRFQL